MRLVIYDLSGIQSFIFATNKLTDMVGGSILVNQALFRNIPELLNEAPNEWAEKDFTFGDGDTAKTVYIGGGNALVMYNDIITEQDITKRLQTRIFEQTRGALRLCTASIEPDFAKTLSENQKDLMDELDRNKRSTPNVSTAKGLSVNAHDNTTFEPVLLFDKGYSPAGAYQKSEANSANKNSKDDNYFQGLKLPGIRYTREFDQHRDKNSKNYLAVVHIDGNTMGQTIRNFVQRQQGTLIDSLNELKKLSAEINSVYQSALKNTVAEVFKGCKGEIPFRPIIIDGDDITFICKSRDAFRITEEFIKKIEAHKSALALDLKFTAGAGIAFVKTGFPFSTAYDIAEQCCKNAKEKALERKEKGKSSVDFHICYSGITTDVREYRKRNFEFSYAAGEYSLALRPYIFGANQDRYDYHKGFAATIEDIIKPGTVARSKLKGLRNAYGEGVLEAFTYGDFIDARAEKEEKPVAQKLAQPFFEDGKARFFDVLDVMDLQADSGTPQGGIQAAGETQPPDAQEDRDNADAAAEIGEAII